MERFADRPRGFALPVVLLALVALTALAHGALALARQQERASRAAAGSLLGRLGAEGGTRLAVAGWGHESRSELRAKGEVTLPEIRLDSIVATRVAVRALGAEWLWFESVGDAHLPELTATRRFGSIHWSLDPGARIRDLAAVVEYGGKATIAGGGVVRAFGAVGDAAEADQTLCEGAAALMEELAPPDGPPALAEMDQSAQDAGEGVAGGFGAIPRVGLLDGHELQDRQLVAQLDSVPVLTVIEGDHVVDGKTYDGLLAVGGDLALTGDALLRGLALVGGSLRVEDGATLIGGARVRQDLFVHETGRVEGSVCRLYHALESIEALALPVSAPGGRWIALH